MVLMTAYRIGEAVIGDVYHEIEVIAADRFLDHTLCFTGSETRNRGGNDVRITAVILECRVCLVLVLSLVAGSL